MKQFCILLLIGISFSSKIYSQENQRLNSREILDKYYALYSEHDYEKALEMINKIHPNDSNYSVASVEKILTLYNLEKYQEAVNYGKKVIEISYNLPAYFFINLGSSYSRLEKYDSARWAYNIGLKKFPEYTPLLYNKARSYMSDDKIDSCLIILKKSIYLNPFNSQNHFLVSELAKRAKQTSLAVLALNMALIVDPTNEFGNAYLYLLDEMTSTKYYDKIEPLNFDIMEGLDLSDIDLLVQNYVGMDKKYKIPSKLSYAGLKQSHVVFSQLSNIEESDNYWYQLYISFFKKMMKENLFTAYSYYITIHSGNTEHKAIVNKNISSVKEFSSWMANEITERNNPKTLIFDGKPQEVNVAYNNQTINIKGHSKKNAQGENFYTGHIEIYNQKSYMTAQGYLNKDGLREGKWYKYDDNGILEQIDVYKDGKQSDSIVKFNKMGNISTILPINNNKLEGTATAYGDYGQLQRSVELKSGIWEGELLEYNQIGVVIQKAKFKDNKPTGTWYYYYNNGNKKAEENYIDGELNGSFTSYYLDGSIKRKCTFKKGLLNGKDTWYHNNGKISSEGKYLDGVLTGVEKQYRRDGSLHEETIYDESGKKNGIYKEYDIYGNVIFELDYNRGEIVGYRFFDKKGNIIKSDERKKGEFYFEGIHNNGNISSKGIYNKKGSQGEWSYYNNNGLLYYKCNYKDNLKDGEITYYYINQNIKSISNYINGLANGEFKSYYKNGNVYQTGYYLNDDLDGEWLTYYYNGELQEKEFYANSVQSGMQYYYDKKGRIINANYMVNGTIVFKLRYDTLGNIFDTINYQKGAGKYVYKYSPESKSIYTTELLNGINNGSALGIYPNGKTRFEGEFLCDNRTGTMKWYHPNGTLSSIISYNDNGEKNGIERNYYKNGSIESIYHYDNGIRHGIDTSYYNNGEINNVYFYENDVLKKRILYTITGEIDHTRIYEDDQLVKIICLDENGNEKENVIKNETFLINSYYTNGQTARTFQMINGEFNGDYIKYYPNGKIYEIAKYKDDEIIDSEKTFYSNGNIKEQYSYTDGYHDGKYEKFYEYGTLKEEGFYILGSREGYQKIYNSSGKLVEKNTWYDGDLISME